MVESEKLEQALASLAISIDNAKGELRDRGRPGLVPLINQLLHVMFAINN